MLVDAAQRAERAEHERWGRLEWAQVLFLCLVTCLHWLPRLRGPIDLRYDSGVYYVLGTSLAEGKGYRLLNEPGQIRAIQYPPLLPVWVALHELVLVSDDPLVVGQALRLSSFALSLLYACCAYALARRLLGPWPALFAALVASLYFHTLFLEDMCFAEVPFALLTLGFFLAREARARSLRALGAPLLAAAAFFVRTAGVALLGAWVLEALARRRWKAALARAALAAGCVLGWQAYVWSVRSSPEYARPAYAYQRAPSQYYNVSYAENMALLDPFAPELGRVTPAMLLERALSGVPRLVSGAGESVSAPRGFWEWPLKSLAGRTGWTVPLGVVGVPLALLGLAVLFGVALLARAGQLLLAFHVLCSLALVSLLPWPAQIPRYLAPLTPLLAIGLARALVALHARARVPAALAAGLVLGVQAFTLRQTFLVYHHDLEYPRAGRSAVAGTLFFFDEAAQWRPFYDALWWLRAHTSEHAVVASSCPQLVWIHARRTAVMPPLEIDPDEAQRLLDSAGVDYLVVDKLRFLDICRRYAAPAAEGHPQFWEVAYRDPGNQLTIYRRKR